MALKRSLIPVVVAVGMVFVLLGFFRTLGARASLSAPAGNAGRIPKADLLQHSRALTGSDPTSHTLFLPGVFSNYRRPFPTVFGAQMYGILSEERVSFSQSQDAKVYWVRWPLSWASIEPTNTLPQDYHWGVYESSIVSATHAGLHLIVTIQNNPDWAATYANGPIDKVDISEFAQFVGALAERYDGDGWEDAAGSPVVDYWEFYNEPDAGDELRARYGASYWGHFGAEYAQMLCAVYPAIKTANPRAQVLLGGLAYDHFEPNGGFVQEFLDDVLAAGGGDCFDVMNFHYYPTFEPVWAPYGHGLSGKANYLYDKLGQYGQEGKPMISTESGWHSDGDSTPEIQTRYVVKLFTQSLASHLDLMIWWTWIDPGSYYGANGLLTQELQPKPAFFAYQAAAIKLGPATFDEIWPAEDPEVEAYRFSTQAGEALYVIWANNDATHTVSLPLSQARLLDMYGEITAVVRDSEDGATDGHVQVSAEPNPIYVEGVP